MNDHDFVLIKLYLKNQVRGYIWPMCGSWLISILETYDYLISNN